MYLLTAELLKPMEAAPCLIKKKDWWSYEFCYGSVIKQYHLEGKQFANTVLHDKNSNYYIKTRDGIVNFTV